MKRVWIDTDLALGAGRGDVDDGWAIAAIARSIDATRSTIARERWS